MSQEYAVIFEKAENNWAAYVPDLPGCAATGGTLEEVLRRIREAIAMHLRGLQEDGLPLPTPNSDPAWVDVELPSPVA